MLKILGGRNEGGSAEDIFYLNGGSKVDFKRERAARCRRGASASRLADVQDP